MNAIIVSKKHGDIKVRIWCNATFFVLLPWYVSLDTKGNEYIAFYSEKAFSKIATLKHGKHTTYQFFNRVCEMKIYNVTQIDYVCGGVIAEDVSYDFLLQQIRGDEKIQKTLPPWTIGDAFNPLSPYFSID